MSTVMAFGLVIAMIAFLFTLNKRPIRAGIFLLAAIGIDIIWILYVFQGKNPSGYQIIPQIMFIIAGFILLFPTIKEVITTKKKDAGNRRTSKMRKKYPYV